MKSTFEKKSTEAVFRCALDAAEWDAALDKAYNRTKNRYKIPGFRPGKATRRMIEMHYGQGVFFDAAVDDAINDAYRDQLAAHPELNVFGTPDVSFEKAEEGEAFAFTITVTLYPEVKLGAYTGIKLPKIEYNVSDEDVNASIEHDLKHAARFVEVDRAAKLGDTVNIDYVGTVDGVEFDGGKADKYDLKLGGGAFIPGFEDGLVGVKKGDVRDVNVTFPEEYHAENLKGKPAVFKVTVNEVRAEEVPELNDEFVKDHYTEYDSVDAYKAGVRKNLEDAAKDRTRSERIDAAMNAIAEASECEVPHKMIHAEIDRLYHEFEHQLSHYGISPEDYLKYNNSSVEKFRSERHDVAEKNVKLRRIMRAIIDAEKIEATDEEVAAKLADDVTKENYEHIAKHNGGDVDEYVKSDIITDKFFDFIVSHNEFVLDKDEKAEGETKEKKEAPAKKPAAKKPATKAKKADGDKA
ncbi:MAG: trigger factor [Clostridiales bacterium]|nr:trigger factor [Clostridiales bacterium]